MLRSARFAWFIALLALGAAILFGIRSQNAERRIETLKESQRRMAEYAQNMQPATFVRADAAGVVYRVPQETIVGEQTFVNTIERTARYGKVFEVFGTVFGDWQVLTTVRLGAPIRVLVRGTGPTAVIEAVYVLP